MIDNKPLREGHSRRRYISSKLNSEQLHTMEFMFPGFVAEYKMTHNKQGKPLPETQHLKLRYIGDQRNRDE